MAPSLSVCIVPVSLHCAVLVSLHCARCRSGERDASRREEDHGDRGVPSGARLPGLLADQPDAGGHPQGAAHGRPVESRKSRRDKRVGHTV